MKIIFWVSNSRLNVNSNVYKIFAFKSIDFYCCSVKLRPLSKILDGATLGNSFKEIRFFIPFPVFFTSFRLFGNNLWNKTFYFLSLE